MKNALPRALAPGLLSAIGLAACTALPGGERPRGVDAVDDEVLRAAAARPADWITHGGDQGETRFSRLEAIHEGNVSRLGLAWSFATGTDRGLEATPLVVDGTLYTTGSWSVVYAIDARTGTELWRWDPQVDRVVGRLACCDVVNRGVALYRGKIYVGVLDGRLVALDARTGTPVWEVATVDPDQPYTITGAPRVVAGKVIIGNGGAEYGVRGYLSAYDAETGERAWRVYTVPGDPALGFESPALEAAAATWTGEWWRYGGGGTAWDSFAYDPELDLLYAGTGNGSPWNREIRSPAGGDNLYLSSILALRPATGEMVWHYQTTPGDTWDFTATQHILLADLPIAGPSAGPTADPPTRTRRVLMQAPKNGFFYVLDRATGELISAEPYTEVTWATGVDPTTGRPLEAPGARYQTARAVLKPGPFGGHNWHPMSYSPETGLVYLPVQDATFVYERDGSFEYRPGSWNTGTTLGGGARDLEIDPPVGALVAWDPVAREARWSVAHADIWNGGTLATAGNLVFQGTSDGRLVAYRASDGEKLWEVTVGGGVIAPPVTYEVDGVQHVAVMAGWGGVYGLTAGRRAPVPGRVLAFALDGTAALGAAPEGEREPPAPIPGDADPALVALGAEAYARSCAVCHGREARGGGAIPDLRYATPETMEAFDAIVLGGARLERGMPSFDATLDRERVEAIRAYVLERRAELTGG